MNPVDDSFDIEGMTQAALQILCDDPSAEVMYICADDPELKRALFAPDGPVSDAAKQGYTHYVMDDMTDGSHKITSGALEDYYRNH